MSGRAAAASGGAAEASETRTLFLSERLGGAEQLGGTKELNLLFDLDQPFLDALFPLADGERLYELIPGSRLIVFLNCGHIPHEEYPEEFTRLVADFCG